MNILYWYANLLRYEYCTMQVYWHINILPCQYMDMPIKYLLIYEPIICSGIPTNPCTNILTC